MSGDTFGQKYQNRRRTVGDLHLNDSPFERNGGVWTSILVIGAPICCACCERPVEDYELGHSTGVMKSDHAGFDVFHFRRPRLVVTLASSVRKQRRVRPSSAMTLSGVRTECITGARLEAVALSPGTCTASGATPSTPIRHCVSLSLEVGNDAAMAIARIARE